MFGIGPTELIVILVIALIVVGPERLPQLAGQIGKAIRDFRQMSTDVTGEFQRAFQLEEEERQAVQAPVLTDEVIGPSGEPPALAAQVIESEPPIAEPAPVAVAAEDIPPPDAPTTGENGYYATPPLATKADPLAGVSLLDEPEPPAATTTYETMPVASFNPPALAEEPPAATNGIADAWDAVLTTEATRSAPEPTADERAAEAAVTAVALAEPPVTALAEGAAAQAPEPEGRPRVDPAAEVTIREVIEGQVAAEAFRERRRVASYQRRK